MQLRNIILPAMFALAVLLLVGLVLQARGSVDVEIDDQALAQARAVHERHQRRASPPPSRPSPSPSPSPRRREAPSRPAASPPAREDIRPSKAAAAPGLAKVMVDPEGEPSLKQQMDNANSLYDKANYESAQAAALEILAEHPKNIRMLRIAVSTACIMAEFEKAEMYYERLPTRDQRQMARRCKKYGVEF